MTSVTELRRRRALGRAAAAHDRERRSAASSTGSCAPARRAPTTGSGGSCGAGWRRASTLDRVGDCVAPRRAHAAVIEGDRVGGVPVIALVVVRDGALPLGAEETIDEAGGRVVVVGDGHGRGRRGAGRVGPPSSSAGRAGPSGPGPGRSRWPRSSRRGRRDPAGVGRRARPRPPASPRRSGEALRAGHRRPWRPGHGRPGRRPRAGGRRRRRPVRRHARPGRRGPTPRATGGPPCAPTSARCPRSRSDPELLDLRLPDPATIDLAEADADRRRRRRPRLPRGHGGARPGGPRGSAARSAPPGSSPTPAGSPFDRQIGTTGAVVDPDLYVAVGISGAVQHVERARPARDVVAVNLDPSCPMMAMADLAIVTDAPACSRWRRRSATAALLAGVRAPEARTPTWLSRFDVVVVGAGPAGSAAALAAARGRPLGLPRRAGSLPRFEEHVRRRHLPVRSSTSWCPRWWEEVPVQRWITRRSTMMATETQERDGRRTGRGLGGAALQRRHHLAPRVRPLVGRQGSRRRGRARDLDHRDRAVPRPDGSVVGVRTDRPDGDIAAAVVIACDGVNSFLAKEAGLYPHFYAEHFTLGAKEVLASRQGGDRPALRPGRPRGRRHRDRRGDPGPARWRLPLHQPRLGGGRGRRPRRGAGRRRPASRGAHRRGEGAPGNRAARRAAASSWSTART